MSRTMKDSGVEWIGKIPEGWDITKLKYVTKNHYSGGTPTASNDNYYGESGNPFVNISDISKNRFLYNTAKSITSAGVANKKLQKVPSGSILYAMYASVGKLSVAKIDAYISQAILAFQNNDNANKSYLIYSLLNMQDHLNLFTNGTTQMNLNAEIVKNFNIANPPLPEQQRIANYLDERVSKIDTIISETKKSIKEYKKYKESLITEAVTKGLDSDVPMKDSGVEWIGEVPVEWGITKLKYVTKDHYSGGTPTASNSNYYGEGNPFVNISDISKGYYLYDTKKSITPAGINNKNLKEVPKGSILYAMYASVGKLSVTKIDTYVSQAILVFNTNEQVYRDYLIYNLLNIQKHLEFYTNGTTQVNLNAETVKNYPIIIPKLPEQIQIANYLDKKTAQIDSLISEKEELLKEMEEYKKSLIFECVTGKRDIT